MKSWHKQSLQNLNAAVLTTRTLWSPLLTAILAFCLYFLLPTEYSKDYCERVVKVLDYVRDLPEGCKQYPAVVKTLESKEKAAANPFAGMSAGEATRARQATRQGRETHAQVQRRLTRMGERRFSKKN